MSPKRRFQVMLDPHTIEYLRKVQRDTGASIGEQIRRAVEAVRIEAENQERWNAAANEGQKLESGLKPKRATVLRLSPKKKKKRKEAPKQKSK